MTKTTSFNFEESLASLETVITGLETGNASLDDSLKTFEQGVVLAKQCQKALDKAQKKIDVLKEKNGELFTQPFNVSPHDNGPSTTNTE